MKSVLVASALVLASVAAVAAVACGGPAVPANQVTGSGGGPNQVTDGAATTGPTSSKIATALAGPQRTDKEKARDKYRHPQQTLEHFGLRDDMTVVELSPGAGWYTSILAPVLRDKGKLSVVGGDPNGPPNSEGTANAKELQARFAATPAAFDKVQYIVQKKDADPDFGPPESADMVVTFRNLHNWMEAKTGEKMVGAAFKVLKHGGILGVEAHRAKSGASTDPKAIGDSGYIPEDYVVHFIEAQGFKLAGKSDVNANPNDTKDYPKGVWTLPPNYAEKDKDHAKYEAIGESDRMTLRFVKP